ncbi:hypothetical protein [Chryseobacterium paridis]|uniref:DUF304 domain-containing protein n=1 Tax=Chryseobacterium paridis TaxID=2800328 RepID=A0ABS1FVG2_9FLAO|nr:hypothetical protein [Chryseobacterium paridis]MBK1896424.1 hypothetical protein [Chryseobacterium paridis]
MEKYQLEITSTELSIKPYFGYLPKIRIFTLLSFVIFCFVPLMSQLNYNIKYILYGLGGIMLFYATYDFLFRASVKFLFDKKTNSIYKIYVLSIRKRLMALDEMTIINTAEYGEMAYAIGKKKKQFLRNYPISDTFSGSKKSTIRETEYVEQILSPILKFVDSR